MSETDIEYGAIIIGGGMSGSWVAKELCDKGVKVLMLERGRDVKHLADYPTASKYPWEYEHRLNSLTEDKEKNPIVNRCYAYNEATEHFFVKDAEDQAYIQDRPFDWIRGYQVGGKSLMWARQVQRWSDSDFEGPQNENFAVDWPIRYDNIKDWYSHVERFIGVSGNKDGLDMLPDGEFQKPLEMSALEKHFQQFIKANYKDRHVIYARAAHLTEPQEIHAQQGRGACQHRMICERGCPFGGYFSANSSTIPWALRTGNLTLRPFSIVEEITYNESTNSANGVLVIDAKTKERIRFKAKTIFVNAGAINSNLILLNSTSNRFPNGLGNDNGLLGKYMAFHDYRHRVSANFLGLSDRVSAGRTITNAYMPRFVNQKKWNQKFKRGYAIALYTKRYFSPDTTGVGEDLLAELTKEKNLGPWTMYAMMMGETIPKESSRVYLDMTKKDEYGIPVPHIDIGYDENDEMSAAHFHKEVTEMFEKAGYSDIQSINTEQAPGLDIHHMGGIRMGHNSEDSLLNKHNQLHLCKNVYVTDGACMTSTGTQNPSLTFMALSARAANHAVEEFDL